MNGRDEKWACNIPKSRCHQRDSFLEGLVAELRNRKRPINLNSSVFQGIEWNEAINEVLARLGEKEKKKP